MNLTLHLFQKDLKRTWVLGAVWLFLVVLNAVVICVGVSSVDPLRQVGFIAAAVGIPLLQWLLLIILIPFVIQLEPLLGTTAFWFTRPISSSLLLRSKGLFLALLILIPLFVEMIVLGVNGATPREMGLAALEVTLTYTGAILTIAVLAALTPNFGFFAVAGSVLIVAGLVIGMVAMFVRLFLDPDAMMRMAQDQEILVSRMILGNILGILGYLLVFIHQYLTRRTRRSIILAAGVVLLSLLVQNLAPWNFLRSTAREVEKLPFDPSALELEVVFLNAYDMPSFRPGSGPRKTITARVKAMELPPRYVLGVEGVACHLTRQNGQVLKISNFTMNDFLMEPNLPALQSTLGMPVVNSLQGYRGSSVTMFSMSDETYAGALGAPLKLAADFDLKISQYEITGELPLKRGARSSRGSEHLLITDVINKPDGVTVFLNQKKIRILLDARKDMLVPQMLGNGSVYVLKNTRRNQAVVAKLNNTPNFMAALSQGLRIINTPIRLDFGSEGEKNPLFPKLTPEWLAEAELVRVDLHKVGSFSKQYRNEAFELAGTKSSVKDSKIGPNLDALGKITLAAQPTREQVEDYVRAILLTSREQTSFSDKDPQVEMLTKIGPENLDILLKIAGPGVEHGDFYVSKAVDRLLRDEDKPLVLGALAENPSLARIVLKKGWEQDARETLTNGIKQKNLPLDWVKAVVALRDPGTYGDLIDYFAQSSGKTAIYDALSKNPDIELNAAVATAWSKARQGRSYETVDMLVPAARSGHIDALEAAAGFLKGDRDGYEKRRARDVFKKCTPATGDDAALLAWYAANREMLVYDSQTQRYTLKP